VSTKKEPAPDAPAAGLEGTAPEDVAEEISNIVEAILGAAVGASERPGLVVASLFVAAKAFAAAMANEQILTVKDVDTAKVFATRVVRGSVMPAIVAIARKEIEARTVCAIAEPRDIATTIQEATQLLKALRRAGNEHPITQLVILYTARNMAQALLQHVDPESYETNRVIVRAMENAMRPHKIEVVGLEDDEPPMPNVPMSKGGDA
jgi:hypothetical protein